MIIHSRLRSSNKGEPLWLSSNVRKKVFYYDSSKIEYVRDNFKKYGCVNNLIHLIDEETLISAFKSIKPYDIKDDITPEDVDEYMQNRDYMITSPGIDNLYKFQYGKCDKNGPDELLIENIRKLYNNMRSNNYYHKPIKRVYIKKPNGKLRPIGISTIEDKIVERAITDVIMVPIYEQIFLDCSFAYRSERNCHKALELILSTLNTYNMYYVLEADIKGYFDNINQSKLIDLIKCSINDKYLIRYIKQVMKAGYLDSKDKMYHKSNRGVPQGGIISPILANIYLHYVLDAWIKTVEFEGKYQLIRYADDFIVLLENKNDAYTLMEKLEERFKKYSLELAREKTNIVDLSLNESSFKFLGYEVRSVDGRIEVNISQERIDRSLNAFEEILESINEDYYKFCNGVKDKLFYGDYIRWINNKLKGTYSYFKRTNKYSGSGSVNYTLIDLYMKTRRLVYDYFITAPNMSLELLEECLIHIVKPYKDKVLDKIYLDG